MRAGRIGVWVLVGLVIALLLGKPVLSDSPTDLGCCCYKGMRVPGASPPSTISYAAGDNLWLPRGPLSDLEDCSDQMRSEGYFYKVDDPNALGDPNKDFACYYMCMGSDCGTGVLNPGEECDNARLTGTPTLGGATCPGNAGTLSCKDTCVLDYSLCTQTCTANQCTSTNPPQRCNDDGTAVVFDATCCPTNTQWDETLNTCKSTSINPTDTCAEKFKECCTAGTGNGATYSYTCPSGKECRDSCAVPPDATQCDKDKDDVWAEGELCYGTDCNDNNKNIWPGNSNKFCSCPQASPNIAQSSDNTCDGVDDDCNGVIDDGCEETCTPIESCTEGACLGGWQILTCTNTCNADTNTKTVPCQAAVCGNGIREGSEQCDFTADGQVLGGETPLCTLNECDACACPATNLCGNNVCDAGEAECNAEGTGPECASDCIEQPNACGVCDDYPAPDGLTARDIHLERIIRLDWSFGQRCADLLRFDVYRKELDTLPAEGVVFDSSFKYHDTNAPTSRQYFDDKELLAQKWYCYAIKPVYKDVNTESISAVVCEDTGDDVCMDGDLSAYCDANDLTKCQTDNPDTPEDEMNEVIVTPCEENTCVKTQKGFECIAQAECDWCNGIFGMFASYPLRVVIGGFNDLCSETPSCYLTATTTINDKYVQCSEVNDCYSYDDETSCEKDSCGRAGGPAACDWNPSSSVFGTGMCVPKDLFAQDCSQCNNLGAGCTLDVCRTYGACYLDSATNGLENAKGCIAKSDFACRYYDTETECTGPNPPTSMKQAVRVAATYTAGVRSGGTHEVIKSNDVLDIRLCEWSGSGYCYKNADNNIITSAKANYKDDCDETNKHLGGDGCYADKTPPVTQISIPPVAPAKFMVAYSKSEDTTETYYRICAESASPCYPDIKLGSANPAEITNTCNGPCKFSYYSEDNARNLEIVKSIRFTGDASAPTVTCLPAEMEYLPITGTDTYEVNAKLTCTVDDPSVSCDGSLMKGTEQIQSFRNIEGLVPESLPSDSNGFTRKYERLADGGYKYKLNCKDAAGNTGTGIVDVWADSQLDITNAIPRDGKYKAPIGIAIGVTTRRDAACKYSLQQGLPNSDFNDAVWKTFATTGLTAHGTTINPVAWNALVSAPLSSTDAHFKLYTGCDFGDKKVIGLPGDIITFTIDSKAPTTIVKNKDGSRYDLTAVKTKHEFMLSCDDPQILASDGSNHSFGCKETKYALKNCKAPASCTAEDWKPITNTQVITLTSTTDVSWQSSDKGVNTEDIVTKKFNVDNQGPEWNLGVYKAGRNVSKVYRYQYTIMVNTTENQATLNKLEIKAGSTAKILTATQVRQNVWSASFSPLDLFGEVQVPEATITATGKDFAGNEASRKITIAIDTKTPPAPQFMPKLEDYAKKGYWVFQHDDTFYTPNSSIFVSGTFEPQTVIGIYLVENVRQTGEPVKRWDQVAKNSQDSGIQYETSIAAPVGAKEITLSGLGEPASTWTGRKYIYQPRDDYMHFNEYYEASAVSSAGPFYITSLTTGLEKALPAGSKIKAYDRAYPYNYWSETVPFRNEYQPYLLFAAAMIDEQWGSSVAYTIIYDAHAPAFTAKASSVLSYGSTSKPRPEITVRINEPNLDETSVKTYLSSTSGTSVPSVTSTLKKTGNDRELTIIPSSNLADGEYALRVSATDYAKNAGNATFSFVVNTKQPELLGERLFPEGRNSPSPTERHYTNSATPSIYLLYNGTGVTVQKIANAKNSNMITHSCSGANYDSLPQDAKNAMSKPNNTYTLLFCTLSTTFTEEEHRINITSARVLHDGTTGSGTHRVTFTVDKTPPQIDLVAPDMTRSGANYTVNGTIILFEEELFLSLSRGAGVVVPGIRNGKNVLFTVPPEYDWQVPEGTENNVELNITVGDYADNTISKTMRVLVDNIKPELTNVTVKPYYVTEGQYIVVNLIDVLLAGGTSNDTKTVCSYSSNGTLIEPCASHTCTDASACVKNKAFIVKTRIPFYVPDKETTSEITLEATDKAGNTFPWTLLITADALAPNATRISITNKDITPIPQSPPTSTGGSGGGAKEKIEQT